MRVAFRASVDVGEINNTIVAVEHLCRSPSHSPLQCRPTQNYTSCVSTRLTHTLHVDRAVGAEVDLL